MRKNKAPRAQAFTLVELIIVMALLATLMAIAAPSLSRSMRGRNLDQEAKRFVALTEYARAEAVSQGVPINVWIDTEAGSYGVEAKTGFPAAAMKKKEFKLNSDVHFDFKDTPAVEGLAQAIELSPEGIPDTSSMESVKFADRTDSVVTVSKMKNGWGYEVVKGGGGK